MRATKFAICARSATLPEHKSPSSPGQLQGTTSIAEYWKNRPETPETNALSSVRPSKGKESRRTTPVSRHWRKIPLPHMPGLTENPTAKSRQLTEKCGMHIKCGKRITKIQRFHYGTGGAIIYIHRVRQYRSVYCPDIISGVPSKILLCSMKPAAKRHQKDYCCKQNPSVTPEPGNACP